MAEEFSRWKSYYYAGTDVLINKPGIRDAAALKAFEYESAFVRTLELARAPVPGKFDLDHLQAIHKHLFQDSYEWAGHLRDVGIAKSHSSFVEPAHLRREADKIHKSLENANFFQGSDKAKFVGQLARHYAELNRLHPFREGNGRATREYLGRLAEQAGYTLDQKRIDADKTAWNAAASKALISGDASGIEKIFKEAVRPGQAVAFEILPRDQALARHPTLTSAFEQLERKTTEIERRYAGNEKALAHFSAHAKAEIVRMLDSGNIAVATATTLGSQDSAPASQLPAARDILKDAQIFAAQRIASPADRAAFLARMEHRYAARIQAAQGRGGRLKI